MGAGALLALLPEALETMPPARAFATLLVGILVFFVLEKLVLLRHCHTDECRVHGATAPLVLLGDVVFMLVERDADTLGDPLGGPWRRIRPRAERH